MIINIPSPGDFYQSGKELFNFAWDATSSLLTELDQAYLYGIEQSEVSEKYWIAARRTLSTSLAIVQQGVELILKGKIAEVSPYLLLSDPPSRWPSPYEGKALDFYQFRTVDAQDLIKILDTFSATQLTKEFSDRFHSLRERRNVIMHSASATESIHVLEVIEEILYMSKVLLPQENWATVRREFLQNSPDSELGSGKYATNRTCREFSIIKEMLAPAQVSFLMNVNKKQRSYFCPSCLSDADKDDDFDSKLAVLRPKGPASKRLYCPVCNMEHEVEREDCGQGGCLGNVIASGTCLTCGH